MPVFALELEPTAEAEAWRAKTNERLNKHDFIRNPFIGSIRRFKDDSKTLFLVEMIPKFYQPPGKIGAAALALCLALAVILGWWIFWVISACVAITFFFYSKYFFYLMAWAALNKNGYKGRPKLYTTEELLLWASKRF